MNTPRRIWPVVTATLVLLLVLYVASFGPACWICYCTSAGDGAIGWIYRPLYHLWKSVPVARDAIDWYARLGVSSDACLGYRPTGSPFWFSVSSIPDSKVPRYSSVYSSGVVSSDEATETERPSDSIVAANSPDPLSQDKEPRQPLVPANWVIEYTWSHDIPRGGTHHVRLDSTGSLTEEWQPHGSDAATSTRTIPARDLQKAFGLAADAMELFEFEASRRARADDVPAVRIALSSESQSVEMQFDDWFSAPDDISAKVRELLRLIQVRVR